MALHRSESGRGRRAWRTALLVLLAAGVLPLLGNSVYMGAGWTSEGGMYLADLPGLIVLTLVATAPFLLLGACAVRTERRLELITITIASLIVVATSAYGYWVVFFPGENSTSTDALIFVLIIPMQLVIAAIAGVIVLARGNRQPVSRPVA